MIRVLKLGNFKPGYTEVMLRLRIAKEHFNTLVAVSKPQQGTSSIVGP